MSEFQYYEFLAIDRPLSPEDKTYVGSLSSRAKPSSTRVVFTYSYSDFNHPLEKVLLRCFDLMVYMANWGSQRLLLRLPKNQVDLPAMQRYAIEDHIEMTLQGEYVLLNLDLSPEEGGYGGWIDENNAIADDLAPLRQDLLNGDYRVLYLAWLALAQMGMVDSNGYDDDEAEEEDAEEEDAEAAPVEPPVPAGLGQLSGALQAFVEWVELEPDLVSAAAIASPALGLSQPEPIEQWVRSLSKPDLVKLVVQMASEDTPSGRQLRAQLRERNAPIRTESTTDTSPRRSFAELKAIARNHAQERTQREQAAAAKKRRQYLEKLAPQVDRTWDQIAHLTQERTAQSYDRAVTLLIDLRELAEMQGRLAQFRDRLQLILTTIKPTSTLYKRLKENSLIPQ